MRVLSFIPALLLAATSFVAASPVGVSTGGNGVSLGASTRSVDTTSDVPALQPYELPLTNATKYLEPLNDQLNALKSSNPDVNKVTGIVLQINAVIKLSIVQLNAAAKVDLTKFDLTNLGAVVNVYVSVVVAILGNLVAIALAVGVTALGPLKTPFIDLLNTVTTLVLALKIVVVGPLAPILGPLFVVVTGTVALLLSIVDKLVVAIAA